MEWVVLGIGLAGLTAWCVIAGPVCRAVWHGRFLEGVSLAPELDAKPLATVSVIVPARDEEQAIRRCLASLAGQDYPHVEIIAVDDRSTDRTGAIMDEVALAHPHVHAEHVTDLSPGWIGKNHANAIGAKRATGDWLLFTDGDVFFLRDCLQRAVVHAESERLDHLSVFPGLESGGYWEQAACTFFGTLMVSALKTWHTRNPLRPDAFCGVGAFNLVRRSAYEAIGTHARFPMEVADDVTLGLLVKRAGYVSDVLAGRPHVTVRWQIGLRGVVRGLEKNAFCAMDYSVARAACGVAALTALAMLPLLGMVFAPGWIRIVYVSWLVSELVALSIVAWKQGYTRVIGLAFPVVSCVLAIAIARSTLLTVWHGGIRWRDTFYPLSSLREGHVSPSHRCERAWRCPVDARTDP